MDIPNKHPASAWFAVTQWQGRAEEKFLWHRRGTFGACECETLKSLTEARKSLEDARKEIKETKERAQLRTTHTFAPLPGFFARPAEVQAVERALSGTPSFTVLVGASSCLALRPTHRWVRGSGQLVWFAEQADGAVFRNSQ